MLLARRGLAADEAEAARLIMAGAVSIEGRRIDKAGELLSEDTDFHVKGRRRFVSRGGDKLAGALDALGLDPSGLGCLDAGCSTGGFTDCLLTRGAARVVAVDVGYGDFAWKLRGDDRVVLMERTNIRNLRAGDLPFAVDLLVADLSFVGLAGLVPVLLGLVRAGGALCLMVKPQFELPRDSVDGGVVRSDALRAEAADRVAAAADALGARSVGRVDSAVAGPDGNREIFLHLEAPVAAPEGGSDAQR